MASVKIFSLAVKTLAKPIANTIKAQATQHETFRTICIGLAQRMHRTEARMRMGLLNEEPKNIKPLNDTRAVQNGATTLAEAFLFLVGAGLVLGESYRSSRKDSRRRDNVAERLEALESAVGRLRDGGPIQARLDDLQEQNRQLQGVLETVISNGLKAGWLSLGHDDQVGQILPMLRASRDLRPDQRLVETGDGDGDGLEIVAVPDQGQPPTDPSSEIDL